MSKIDTISILGPKACGKTNLLSTLMFNHNARRDLSDFGLPGAIIQPAAEDGDNRRRKDELLERYRHILYGRDDELEGSSDVWSYKCHLEYDGPQSTASGGGWASRRRVPTKADRIGHDFEIVDALGGASASARTQTTFDDSDRDFQQQLRDRVDDSVGVVIMLSALESAESGVVTKTNLEDELRRMLERKAKDQQLPRLKHIAVCITKYECLFEPTAGIVSQAGDPKVFRREALANTALGAIHRTVLSNSDYPDRLVRFFPVSSYGFTPGPGSPNFYDWPSARGLKTRAIDPSTHYENPDIPDYKDHFPIELSEPDAERMWFPFNVAPPIVFALTGQVCGPLSLSAQELGLVRAEPA